MIEVWAKPPGRDYRVRIRVYSASHWQVAVWTSTVLKHKGYKDVLLKETPRVRRQTA